MTRLGKEIPQRIIDQNADTIEELEADTGWSQDWLLRYARKQVKDCVWERVWKKVGGRCVPAYRHKKH